MTKNERNKVYYRGTEKSRDNNISIKWKDVKNYIICSYGFFVNYIFFKWIVLSQNNLIAPYYLLSFQVVFYCLLTLQHPLYNHDEKNVLVTV